LYFIRPQWNETRNQSQEKVQKTPKCMDTEKFTLEWSVCHQRNKRGIKKFLESSENENTAYQKLWNTTKTVQRAKFITTFRLLIYSTVVDLCYFISLSLLSFVTVTIENHWFTLGKNFKFITVTSKWIYT
jgi:SRSO17 transposase